MKRARNSNLKFFNVNLLLFINLFEFFRRTSVLVFLVLATKTRKNCFH